MREISKTIAAVQAGIKSQNNFTLDTNRLITLANHGKTKELEDLIGCDKYLLTSVNAFEIFGLSRGHRLGKDTQRILKWFINAVKLRNRYIEIDASEIQKQLKPLAVLIPRKLVHDVMITLPNSFLKRLEERYDILSERFKRGRLSNSDIVRAGKDYEEDLGSLDVKLKERFDTLCDKLDIDSSEINQRDYFSDIQKFKRRLLAEVQALKQRIRKFDILILALRDIANKNYRNDIKYVAQTIAAGAVGQSSDSDVIFLFEAHAALAA